VAEIWYRYDDVTYAAAADEWGESRGPGHTEIVLREYRVIRHTPKGAWVVPYHEGWGWNWSIDDKKFVLYAARKRLCYPSKVLALESLVARKRAMIRIYNARISGAQRALTLADQMGNLFGYHG
jgi:hypothetical protein